jgi:hypothetical protein
MFRFASPRRAVVGAIVALAVAAPLLACSGMGGGSDPKAEVVGSWKFFPSAEELRFFKIVAKAAKGQPKDAVEKAIGGAMTAEEEQMYELIRRNPNAPDVKGVVAIADQMKAAKVEISETEMKMAVQGNNVYQKPYTVTAENGTTLDVTLGGDEKHKWTVVSHDEITVEVVEPMQYSASLKRQ